MGVVARIMTVLCVSQMCLPDYVQTTPSVAGPASRQLVPILAANIGQQLSWPRLAGGFGRTAVPRPRSGDAAGGGGPGGVRPSAIREHRPGRRNRLVPQAGRSRGSAPSRSPRVGRFRLGPGGRAVEPRHLAWCRGLDRQRRCRWRGHRGRGRWGRGAGCGRLAASVASGSFFSTDVVCCAARICKAPATGRARAGWGMTRGRWESTA